MRRCRPEVVVLAALLALALTSAPQGEAGEFTVSEPDGEMVRWSEWIGAKGPAAVVVWASWAPGAATTLRELDGLAAAARDHGLELVIVAVQERLQESASALASRGVVWLHDRHGAILKEYRLIRVPTLAVVDRDGAVVARLDPSAAALRAWQP